MESQQKNSAVPLILGMVAVSTLGALIFIFGGEEPPPPGTVVKHFVASEPTLPPSALLTMELQRQEEEAVRARQAASNDRMMIHQDKMMSELLERGRQPRYSGVKAGPPVEDRRPKKGKKLTGEPAPDNGSGDYFEINDAERSLVERLSGLKIPDDLYKMAGTKKVVTAVLMGVAKYPKIVRFLLNNEMFIEGAMNNSKVKKNCNNIDSLTRYMKNSNDSTGINSFMGLIQSGVKQHKDLPVLAAGSKLTSRMLACPAVNAMLNDSNRLAGVMTENTNIPMFLGDPNIMSGIMSNPTALQAFTKASVSSSTSTLSMSLPKNIPGLPPR
ncbi:MAG: hypothetical protein COB53_09640 [Elusimicrobia bacterium]|nr:MAG: hypothetical protein COB53_09640 [Elusimicrobiota bacterium]